MCMFIPIASATVAHRGESMTPVTKITGAREGDSTQFLTCLPVSRLVSPFAYARLMYVCRKVHYCIAPEAWPGSGGGILTSTVP